MAFEEFFMPLQFIFMQKAFLIAIILSFPTAILSCFLVIKGWALMGDAISHAVLPGIVIAYIVGIPLLIGAFIAGMLCAWGTGFFSDNSRIKEDTIMGIIFSGMFGLGIVLFVAFDTTAHLEHILFGNILGIDKSDILTALIITFIIVLFFAIFWRAFRLSFCMPFGSLWAWFFAPFWACIWRNVAAKRYSSEGSKTAVAFATPPRGGRPHWYTHTCNCM